MWKWREDEKENRPRILTSPMVWKNYTVYHSRGMLQCTFGQSDFLFFNFVAPKWRFELFHIFKMPNTTIKSDFNSRFNIYFWENRKNPRLFDLLYWTFVGPISQSNLFILFRRPIFYYSTKSQVLIHHRSWFWASSFFKSFTIVGSYFMIQTTYPL